MNNEYYFDGGLFKLLLVRLLGAIITIITLGIATPWAITMVYKWEAEHTVLAGRRLSFTGSPIGLFGQWIKWWFLTVITFGIYGFWVGIALKKWKTKNLRFVN